MYNCLAVLDAFPAISVEVNFKISSEDHTVGTPLDDLHFRDRFSPPPSPAHCKISSRFALLVCTCDHFDQAQLAQVFHPTHVDAFRARELDYYFAPATRQCVKHENPVKGRYDYSGFVRSFLPQTRVYLSQVPSVVLRLVNV